MPGSPWLARRRATANALYRLCPLCRLRNLVADVCPSCCVRHLPHRYCFFPESARAHTDPNRLHLPLFVDYVRNNMALPWKGGTQPSLTTAELISVAVLEKSWQSSPKDLKGKSPLSFEKLVLRFRGVGLPGVPEYTAWYFLRP